MPRRRTDAYLAKRVREFERRCVIRILRRVDGDMAEAAKRAGRDRASFYCLVKRHGIDYRAFRSNRSERTQAAPAAEAAPREWFGVPLAADRLR